MNSIEHERVLRIQWVGLSLQKSLRVLLEIFPDNVSVGVDNPVAGDVDVLVGVLLHIDVVQVQAGDEVVVVVSH